MEHYLLPQARSQKQHIIRKLAERSELVVLNHPHWMGGYSEGISANFVIDLLKCSMISGTQVLWDVALSSGKPAMIQVGTMRTTCSSGQTWRDRLWCGPGPVTPGGYTALGNGTAYGREVTRHVAGFGCRKRAHRMR